MIHYFVWWNCDKPLILLKLFWWFWTAWRNLMNSLQEAYTQLHCMLMFPNWALFRFSHLQKHQFTISNDCCFLIIFPLFWMYSYNLCESEEEDDIDDVTSWLCRFQHRFDMPDMLGMKWWCQSKQRKVVHLIIKNLIILWFQMILLLFTFYSNLMNRHY